MVILGAMVLLATFILFLIVLCIIINFAKKITNPISILTTFTNELKKKQSIHDKRDFVNSILEKDIFRKLNEAWKV